MRRFLITTCFGLFYLASILIGDCFAAGTRWQDGIADALIFGTFFFVISFPLILLLQVGLKRLVARWLKISPGKTPLWGFLPMVAISLLFLSGLRGVPPESHIRRFVVDPLPPSIHDAHAWYRRCFNSSIWVLSFRIDPSELDRVLSRHPYKQTDCRQGHDLSLLGTWVDQGSDFPVPYPKEPMVVSYSYNGIHSDGSSGKSITIYVNEQRNLVYAMGSY